jgi:hypothetical protein
MSTEYIWFKKGKESKRTADPEGKLPTVENLPNGRTATYTYNNLIIVSKHIKKGGEYDGGNDPAISQYDRNGNLLKEQYVKDDYHHRDGGKPAIIGYNISTGKPFLEEYYIDGKRHRENDKPAVVEDYASSGKHEVWWFKGTMHRDGDKPADISTNNKGVVTQETWYVDNKQHREGDKPSELRYWDNGNLKVETYTIHDGMLHRDGDKPAQIMYNENGDKQESRYYEVGNRIKVVEHTKKDLTKSQKDFNEISDLLRDN